MNSNYICIYYCCFGILSYERLEINLYQYWDVSTSAVIFRLFGTISNYKVFLLYQNQISVLIPLRYKRFLLCLIGFKLHAAYVPGKMFIIADAFSSNPLADKCTLETGEHREICKRAGKANLPSSICRKDQL